MCTACNRNLWSQANLFETRKQNNKHGSLSTSRTRKGVLAFPAGGSELLTALQPKSPECHTAVTQSSQFPWGDLTFRFPQSLPEILPKDFLSASPPPGHFLPPRITLPLHLTMPPDAPRPASKQDAISPLLAPNCRGKAAAEKQTFRAFTEGGRARGALTAG